MSRVRAQFLVAAFLVPAIGVPSGAQEPATARLALVPGPGKPVRFVHRHETRQEVAMGKSVLRTDASGSTELSIEVLAREPDGTHRAVLRIGRIRMKAKSLVLSIDADSASPLPVDEAKRASALAVLACADSEFRATLDAGGAVTRVEGIEAARAGAVKRWSVEEAYVGLVDESITEEKVKQTFGWAFLATPFPASEIAAGHAWDDADVLPGTAKGMVIRTKRRFEVGSVSADEVSLAGKGEVEVSGPPVEGATERKSEVADEVRVSRADGLPLAAKETLRFSLSVATPRGAVPMTQTTTTSLERVAAWPSRDAAPAPAGPPK